MYELSTISLCVGKMKALLAAKRSPVRWGSQMCLNVQWGSIYIFHFVANCPLSFCLFTPGGNGWAMNSCRFRSNNLSIYNELYTSYNA